MSEEGRPDDLAEGDFTPRARYDEDEDYDGETGDVVTDLAAPVPIPSDDNNAALGDGSGVKKILDKVRESVVLTTHALQPKRYSSTTAAQGGSAGASITSPMQQQAVPLAPPPTGVLRYVHLWASKDGATHIRDCECRRVEAIRRAPHNGDTNPLAMLSGPGDSNYLAEITTMCKPTRIYLTQRRFSPSEWEYAPAVQFVVTLSGSWFLKASDGSGKKFRPGDVLFQDDVAKGPAAMVRGKNGDEDSRAWHLAGVAGGGPCNLLVIEVDRAPQVDNPGPF